MKQSEIDKELRGIAKAAAKARGWKSVAGMPYWTIGPLFFVLVLSADAKSGRFRGSLSFKWLELDRALWHVLGIGNEIAPFSLHANGAFVLSGQQVLFDSKDPIDWVPGALEQQVQDTMQNAHERAVEIASRIGTIDAYLSFIQREHAAFMASHPQAMVDVWKEALLVALLKGDRPTAADIARSRIGARDSGGYISAGKTFYQHALELCERRLS